MKDLLKKTCVTSWFLLAVIIILGLISPSSPDIFQLYIKIINPLFWTFWGLTLASLLLLIPVMAAEINKMQMEERNGGEMSELLILLLVIPTGLIVMESYLLIETSLYMWSIIFLFAIFHIIMKYTNKYKMKENLLNVHFNFIAALGLSILILYTFCFLPPFYQPFLTSAKFIDNTVFFSMARKVGDNYADIRKNEIKLIPDASPVYYQSILDDYTQQLKFEKLTGGILPHEFQGNKTNHSIFIERSWELLDDNTIPGPVKQKIMASLLDYLTQVIRKGYFDAINSNDEGHKINIILLGKLDDFVLQYEPDKSKWKCFLCRIKKYTTINVSQLGAPLGTKECEPCLDDHP